MIHASVADMSEHDLVRRILADVALRSTVIRLDGIPDNAVAMTKVLLEGAPRVRTGSQGDVDVLLCAPDRPDAAIAIEVKRLKVGAKAISTGQPNKLPGLPEAVEQANRLAGIGFSQVYLFVFVSVDSRTRNLGRPSWDGMPIAMKHLIHRKISDCQWDLPRRIGLLHWETTQLQDHEPLDVGSRRTNLLRRAELAQQPDALSQWIADVLSRNLGKCGLEAQSSRRL